MGKREILVWTALDSYPTSVHDDPHQFYEDIASEHWTLFKEIQIKTNELFAMQSIDTLVPKSFWEPQLTSAAYKAFHLGAEYTLRIRFKHKSEVRSHGSGKCLVWKSCSVIRSCALSTVRRTFYRGAQRVQKRVLGLARLYRWFNIYTVVHHNGRFKWAGKLHTRTLGYDRSGSTSFRVRWPSIVKAIQSSYLCV